MQSPRPLGAPAARFARAAGLILIGVLGAATGAVLLLPLIGRGFVHAIQLMVAGCVWLATSISVGVSMWDVLATIGRAALGSLATPAGSLAFSILVVVGITALYWLQRLLESEEESAP